jgi:nicotinamidase-related amidase
MILASLLAALALHNDSAERTYENRLTPLEKPAPILADHPEFVEPLGPQPRFLAPAIVDEAKGDLEVRAWRFSYNARGIIEMPNRLVAAHTAVIVVHPWGIDDGQGWKSPEPAGVAMFCTPEKNRLYHKHIEKVVNPFLKSLRGKAGLIAYSLPGKEDAIRRKLYRSIRTKPTDKERADGAKELTAKLNSFKYKGDPLSAAFTLGSETTTAAYFKKFPGLDAGPKFDPKGFWELPIPVVKGIDVAANDVVIYDGDGYPPLRDFLKKQGIRHVLLAGYATDMCVCSTTAGYKNLAPDFNLFVVGDATLATFPAAPTPKHATQAALGMISLEHLVTQVSWVKTAVSKRR